MAVELVALLCAVAWVAGVAAAPAGAARRSPGRGVKEANSHHQRHGHSHGHAHRRGHGQHHRHGHGHARHHGHDRAAHGGRRHGGGLPAIGHAEDLTVEPVVHADKGKPPAKLLVKNLVHGSGSAVTASSVVEVKYVGANYRTGQDFTSGTWTSGRPAAFALSGVIPGFAAGLMGMRVGGRREIVIPPRLGYRDHAQGPIKPHETLVFVVDMVAIKA